MSGSDSPALVVLAGLPGVGKTTIARALAPRLRAAVMRVDAIEAAVVRHGLESHPVGPVGYAIAHELAAECLRARTSVIVDAVNPVAAARAGWRDLAAATGARLTRVEVVLADGAEHRRRVTARVSDVDGLVVPRWDEVVASGYEPWDEQRDGVRLVVDGASCDAAVSAILSALADV
ncbi:MAG TPA: ATP-binding protein [Jatrophihabitantaceae bacterium]|nr:ATP-binding protein [Jatrophihabitantaceae bacterium]